VVRLVVASFNISDIILHSARPSLAEQQEFYLGYFNERTTSCGEVGFAF